MKLNMPKPSKACKTQTFRFAAPEAMSVLLVGDFTHWQKGGIPMRKKLHGVWEATVALAPGKHSYRFLVDGQWRDDPECEVRVPNPFGSEDMIREAA
jgi:1,4-alpha-glucan branching enzyme